MGFDWIEWDLVSGYLTLEKHILLGHLLANASESRSCPCLHFQLISFISTSSPTTTLWLCHIQLQVLDSGGI